MRFRGAAPRRSPPGTAENNAIKDDRPRPRILRRRGFCRLAPFANERPYRSARRFARAAGSAAAGGAPAEGKGDEKFGRKSHTIVV